MKLLTLNFERALVTGGAGFIGSHLVDRLLAEGCQVTVLDDLSSGTKQNLSQLKAKGKLRFIHGSILDPQKVASAMRDADRVFHEAAIVSGEFANQNPLETANVNCQGTVSVLEAARRRDLDQFIYASSAAVYGRCDSLPIREEFATNPLSPYGASKLAGERFTQAYHSTYNLKTTCLRYFNVYGPRQVLNDYSGVITIFLQRLREGRALEIHGDGEQTRDFIYVSDVVEANLKAATKPAAVGEVVNIATGKTTSINMLADLLGSILDLKVMKRRVDPRSGDIRHSYADTHKAHGVFDFDAAVRFEDGLRRYATWIEQT